MTLVRYGQAAMIAAIMTLMGNAVWAQQGSVEYGVPKTIYFTVKPACCKDGKCCKEGASCCESKKCDAKCSCTKDSKCACCKDGECCCDKNGKCSCSKDKTSTAKSGCDCCPFLSKLAKKTAIIMVMPASMPLPACCMEAMGILPHPPMPMPPPGPHVFLPPMPPMPPFPPTPSMGMPGMPPMQVECAPMPMYYNTSVAACPSTGCPAPASSPKFEIVAPESCDQLEMSIGENAGIRCKKMTVKIGDTVMAVSRFDDRVRIRGEELKATADCVRTEGKDRLILEGNVVMHSKKDGNPSASVMKAEYIDLNLTSGAVTIKSSGKASSSPAVHIERVDSIPPYSK